MLYLRALCRMYLVFTVIVCSLQNGLQSTALKYRSVTFVEQCRLVSAARLACEQQNETSLCLAVKQTPPTDAANSCHCKYVIITTVYIATDYNIPRRSIYET